MHLLTVLSLLATSATVLAQGTSTSTAADASSTCDAQNIVDACVASIQIQVDACGANEWDCLCEQTNNLLTCYNNCPRDPNRNGVQQQNVSYCNAAEANNMLTSTSTSASASASSTTATQSSTATASATTSGGATEETATDAAGKLGGSKTVLVGAGLGVVALLV